jgi:formylglycine-generating enzyme required for sulfatase activity
MKWEAKLKNNGTITEDGNFSNAIDYTNSAIVAALSAEATSEGRPWVRIRRTDSGVLLDAERACSNLGSGYTLINNAQWQAIARNIEGQLSNWTNGTTTGTNSINTGHSDNNPSQACDGTVQNVEGDCLTLNTTASQKRTHDLSTGEVIWDIAGNVWEMVSDNNTTVQGPDSYVSLLTSSTANLAKWGPAGDYTTKNSGEYGGLGIGFLSRNNGAVSRGGFWISVHASGALYSTGVYTTRLDLGPTAVGGSIGFRCVRSVP